MQKIAVMVFFPDPTSNVSILPSEPILDLNENGDISLLG